MSKFIEITLSTGEVQIMNTRYIRSVRKNQKGQTEITMQNSDKPHITEEKYEIIRTLLVDPQK